MLALRRPAAVAHTLACEKEKTLKNGNVIEVAETPRDNVAVKGRGNRIVARCLAGSRNFQIKVHGDNNTIDIGRSVIKDLSITIGSYLPVSGVTIRIGDHFSIEPGGRFVVFTDFGRIDIGRNCLFSRNINIHYGDSPHLIFNKTTGEYRDGGGGISIGDHVWVGEDVYLTKNAGVARDCIVAARCVLTKTFDEPNSAYGGNPAKKIASDIEWFRNRQHVPRNSIYSESIENHDRRVREKSQLLYDEPNRED